MNNAYIRNMETGKIELHFDKEDYQALPETDKKKIKSNFLFSKYSKAWISRSKEPNLYHVIQIAKSLGFTEEERTGERISFAEQMDRKAERAEERADRFETYAANAEKRAERLQSEFNRCREDWSWITQPIISGHAGSQRFGRQREKILDRYHKGFDEYRKSEYFKDRASTAQATADNIKMSDKVYLDNRIGECEKNIKAISNNIARYEDVLFKLDNKDPVYVEKYDHEKVSSWVADALERLEAEIDKQGYFQNALDAIGGIVFSKSNIKPGYVVKIRGCEKQILKANPKTVEARVVSGGAAGMILKYNYSEIQEVIKATEEKPKQEIESHPYKKDDILVFESTGGNRIIRAYQILSVTDKTIQIQQIKVVENKPIMNDFIPNSKPQRKKPTVRKWDNQWTVYEDNWTLYKYSA